MSNRVSHRSGPREPTWRFRGYLPHYDNHSVIQAITFRLADSFPQGFSRDLKHPAFGALERSRQCEVALDKGYGSCLLRTAENAELMVSTWRLFSAIRYDLHAWVVMPNHIHVLVAPLGTYTLPKIIHSWKSFTAKRMVGAAAMIEAEGRVWQPEYFDRFVRDEKHYRAVVDYIHANPVKAKLVGKPEDWRWSSAREWKANRE